jgi:cytochrome c-type biogenesis protein CcmH
MTSERMGNSCVNWSNILGALLLGCALINIGAWAQTAPAPREAKPMANNPAVEARLVDISQELRCMVCQNESLASSHAELAEDLRREVRDLIVQGKTDSEIKTFLVDRYGDFVLYRPEVKPLTWVLWFGPFFLLLLAAFALGAYLRQRKKQVTSLELSDAQRKRAEQLLKGKP